MAHFVLVHGAWHGAWCWRHVTEALIRAGHRAHAVTLTGLGERAHLLSPAITLETHIADVIGVIEAEELDDVVLAVHSYAGMLGTAGGAPLPHPRAPLGYVRAGGAQPRASRSGTPARATREARLAAAAADANHSFPPPDPVVFGLDGPAHDWVRRRQTPHPGHTYEAPLDFDPGRVARVPRTFINCTQPPLATIDVIRSRVSDPRFWDGAWLPGAKVVDLPTGHDPMVSEPAALVRLLLERAA